MSTTRNPNRILNGAGVTPVSLFWLAQTVRLQTYEMKADATRFCFLCEETTGFQDVQFLNLTYRRDLICSGRRLLSGTIWRRV
jgi:hypothetical protein